MELQMDKNRVAKTEWSMQVRIVLRDAFCHSHPPFLQHISTPESIQFLVNRGASNLSAYLLIWCSTSSNGCFSFQQYIEGLLFNPLCHLEGISCPDLSGLRWKLYQNLTTTKQNKIKWNYLFAFLNILKKTKQFINIYCHCWYLSWY